MPWVTIGPWRALADRDRARLRLAADPDRLVVDHQRLPRVAIPGGGPVVAQSLLVEVLDVPGDVRCAPGMMGCRAEDDPGRERQRYAAGLVAGRDQMQLEPRPGWITSRWGSLASSGMPDAVMEPETTQSFEPWPRALGASGMSSSVASRPSAHPTRRAAARTPSCSRATTRDARKRRRTAAGRPGRRARGRAASIRPEAPARRRSTPGVPHGTGRGCVDPRRSRPGGGGRPPGGARSS